MASSKFAALSDAELANAVIDAERAEASLSQAADTIQHLPGPIREHLLTSNADHLMSLRAELTDLREEMIRRRNGSSGNHA